MEQKSHGVLRILVAEDDALLGDGLQAGLRQRGFDADWAKDGVAAQVALRAGTFEAVVLDLGLPLLDGLELLRNERALGSKLPVLILSARDAAEDRQRSFDTGADDYLVKPVDLDELAARLRALVRRSRGGAQTVLVVGELRLDPAARSVTLRGRPVDLEANDYNLLHQLLLNAGRVLTREQIEQRMNAWGEVVKNNAVEIHIDHLRRKLAPNLIHTVRGLGYMLPRDRKRD